MCARFKCSWMLLIVALLFSFDSKGSFLTVSGTITLWRLRENATFVIPKEDMDAGKISYTAIIPDYACLVKLKKDDMEIDLIDSTNDCRIEMKWDIENFYLGRNYYVEHKRKNMTVNVFDDGQVDFNDGKKKPKPMQEGCKFIFKPNNNTDQGGYVVNLRIENYVKNCWPGFRIKFGNNYKFYEPLSQEAEERRNNKLNRTVLIGAIIFVSLVAITILLGFVLCCWWVRKERNAKSDVPDLTKVSVVPAQEPKPKEVNISRRMPKEKTNSKKKSKKTQPQPAPETKTPIPVSAPAQPTPIPMNASAQPTPTVIESILQTLPSVKSHRLADNKDTKAPSTIEVNLPEQKMSSREGSHQKVKSEGNNAEELLDLKQNDPEAE